MKIYEVDLCCTRSHFPMSVQLEDKPTSHLFLGNVILNVKVPLTS